MYVGKGKQVMMNKFKVGELVRTRILSDWCTDAGVAGKFGLVLNVHQPDLRSRWFYEVLIGGKVYELFTDEDLTKVSK